MKKIMIAVGTLAGILLAAVVYQRSDLGFSKVESADIQPSGYEYYYTEEESKPETVKKEVLVRTEKNVDDKITVDTDPNSYKVIVNRNYPISSEYVPNDLVIPKVPYSFYGIYEKSYMRKKAAKSLKKLFEDAYSKKGYTLKVVSAYRSYERQKEIYNNNVLYRGEENTNKVSANPGCSEHQTGLAIDISTPSVSNRIDESFGKCKEGKWVKRNAHKYGFIIRYPKGKTDITGYEYEPWHLRFVGIKFATYLYKNKLTLEEYYNVTGEVPKNEKVVDTDVGAKDDKQIKTAPKPKVTITPFPSFKSKHTHTPKPTKKASTAKPKFNTKEPFAIDNPTKTPTATKKPKVTKKPTKTKKPTPTKTPAATKKPAETKKPTETKKPPVTKTPVTDNPNDYDDSPNDVPADTDSNT